MSKAFFHFFVGCLLGIVLLAYVFPEHFIFPVPPSSYSDTPTVLKIKTKNGVTLSAIYLSNPKAKYTILVSHGNAEDIGRMYPWLKTFEQHGFSIFAYDYAGYGTSTGKPSEKQTYQNIDAAYNYLTQDLKIPPQNIILYGRSLGAAVSIDLAARQPVAAVIVEAAFVSAYRVLTVWPLLPFDKFNNLAKIKNIHVPILFIHGQKDFIVPSWHGKKLFAAANQPKQAWWVGQAGHNNIVNVAGEKYWQTIMQFVKSLN